MRPSSTDSNSSKMVTRTREREEADRLLNETDTQRTGRVLLKIFNSIEKDLKFTIELEDDFDDRMLPTLDTKMSMKDVEMTLGRIDEEIRVRRELLTGEKDNSSNNSRAADNSSRNSSMSKQHEQHEEQQQTPASRWGGPEYPGEGGTGVWKSW